MNLLVGKVLKVGVGLMSDHTNQELSYSLLDGLGGAGLRLDLLRSEYVLMMKALQEEDPIEWANCKANFFYQLEDLRGTIERSQRLSDLGFSDGIC